MLNVSLDLFEKGIARIHICAAINWCKLTMFSGDLLQSRSEIYAI